MRNVMAELRRENATKDVSDRQQGSVLANNHGAHNASVRFVEPYAD